MFGRFGIAFKKAQLIKYGANPALYTTGIHFERIRRISELLARMKDREKDREWRQDMEPYPFTEDETVALNEVTAFLQEYSYKNNDQADYVTYYQREWRLAFNSLQFASGSQHPSPGMSAFHVRNGNSYPIVAFDPADIEYIVVPLRFWCRARRIASVLRCKVKIYECAVG
jgi:hypothetical protein